MRKTILAIAAVAAALALAPGGVTLVEHQRDPTNVCVGDQCGILYANVSVESVYKDRGQVNCPQPNGSPSTRECYDDWTDSRNGSAGWGPSANTALVGGQTVGPVTFGGVYTSPLTPGATAVRVWTGARVDGVGSGSVAASGGMNSAGNPYVCVSGYGADETPGHAIADALNDAGIADDPSDYDTDVTVCAEALRGV